MLIDIIITAWLRWTNNSNKFTNIQFHLFIFTLPYGVWWSIVIVHENSSFCYVFSKYLQNAWNYVDRKNWTNSWHFYNKTFYIVNIKKFKFQLILTILPNCLFVSAFVTKYCFFCGTLWHLLIYLYLRHIYLTQKNITIVKVLYEILIIIKYVGQKRFKLTTGRTNPFANTLIPETSREWNFLPASVISTIYNL